MRVAVLGMEPVALGSATLLASLAPSLQPRQPVQMHVLNHMDHYFQVKGPLNVARMPQGRPIMVKAGANEPGLAERMHQPWRHRAGF